MALLGRTKDDDKRLEPGLLLRRSQAPEGDVTLTLPARHARPVATTMQHHHALMMQPWLIVWCHHSAIMVHAWCMVHARLRRHASHPNGG